MTIGTNIKNIRKHFKFTQVELAKKANISRSYLADVENDRYNPSLTMLHAIAKALNIHVESLVKSAGYIDDSNIESVKEYIKSSQDIEVYLDSIFEQYLNKITDDGVIYKPFRDEIYRICKLFGYNISPFVDFFVRPNELRTVYYTFTKRKMDFISMFYYLIGNLPIPHADSVDKYLSAVYEIKKDYPEEILYEFDPIYTYFDMLSFISESNKDGKSASSRIRYLQNTQEKLNLGDELVSIYNEITNIDFNENNVIPEDRAFTEYDVWLITAFFGTESLSREELLLVRNVGISALNAYRTSLYSENEQ